MSDMVAPAVVYHVSDAFLFHLVEEQGCKVWYLVNRLL